MDGVDPLIEHGLRFGGLLRISEEHVVERYNKALVAFGLKPVAEAPLYVDLCGFSLEVAAKLGDLHYLDPAQVNPRFIIVSSAQATAPLVHTSFSSTKKLFQAFYRLNAQAIDLITLKDAIYGEIENSLMQAHTLEDILSFPHVDFEFHTVDGLLEDSERLTDLIEKFRSDATAWTDVGLMQNIVDLARKCGDIRKNPIAINSVRFRHPKTFSTTLFGGATIIDGTVVGKREELLKVSNGKTTIIDIGDCQQVLGYLDINGLLEEPNMEWLVSSEFLDHRLEMLAADILAGKVESLDPFVVNKYPEAIMQNNVGVLMQNDIFRELDRLRTLIINSGPAVALDYLRGMSPRARAMVRRAEPNKASTNDVNRILSSYFRADYLCEFILDKPAFYALFKTLDPVRRDFAAKLIKTRYMPHGVRSDSHKQAVKDLFFGTYQI
ncbi:hypothetical protein GOB57_08985 [Sinorhizobium meliloti]|nr:hypothetical protein [Sinorhizobium meliloti]